MEAALHLRPLVLQLAHAGGVHVEGLMLQHEQHQVGLAAQVGALGQLLQEVGAAHVAGGLAHLELQKLAEFVEHEQQAASANALQGVLQGVYQRQNVAFRYVLLRGCGVDVLQNAGFAAGAALPERAGGDIQGGEQAAA